MNWIKKIIRPLLLFGLPLVVIACTVSYKFNGSSINYDKVKTISIADFPIKSEYVYAPLATKFNEDLKDIFIRQTRLQLLKPEIPSEIAEHIFIPFFTTKENGSGIGLSISRQIMRLSGGSLTLLREKETTFILKFK